MCSVRGRESTVARRLRTAKTTLACVGGGEKKINRGVPAENSHGVDRGRVVIDVAGTCQLPYFVYSITGISRVCTSKWPSFNVPSESAKWCISRVHPEQKINKYKQKVSLFFYTALIRPIPFKVAFDAPRGHIIQQTHMGCKQDKR